MKKDKKLILINKTLNGLFVLFTGISVLLYLIYRFTLIESSLIFIPIFLISILLRFGFKLSLYLFRRGSASVIYFYINILGIALSIVIFILIYINNAKIFGLGRIITALIIYFIAFSLLFKYYNKRGKRKNLDFSIIERRPWMYCQAPGCLCSKIYPNSSVCIINGRFYHTYVSCMNFGKLKYPKGKEKVVNYDEAKRLATGKNKSIYHFKKPKK